MFLFLLTNLFFLGSFAWLVISGAGWGLWGAWLLAWFCSDYAVTWMTGYMPPAWVWGAILAILAGLWTVLPLVILGN